jgi:hypothetical protein
MTNLTALGIVHTVLSVIAVIAAPIALIPGGRVSSRDARGQFYLIVLTLAVLTGLPIFRTPGIKPPHVTGVVILIATGVALLAERGRTFGRASAYIATAGYSTTLLLLAISTVTETLTRLPLDRPLAAGPDAPVFNWLYSALFVLFAVGVALQFRRLRVPSPRRETA